MRQFNLQDNSLYYLNTTIYQNSLVSDRYSRYFEWVKKREDLPTFFTYTEFQWVVTSQAKEKNAVLLESSAIVPEHVRWLHENYNEFNNIYTHNSRILRDCPNARWIPGGGCWIGTEFGGGTIGMSPKSKLCSFVSSDKRMCDLHRLRFNTFKYLQGSKLGSKIDFFGTATGPFVKANDYLQDYYFSIIFENYVDDLYFTEKLLNCFATGTIPIYIGASGISSIFDAEGIMRFSNPKELVDIVSSLSIKDYEDRINSVSYNLSKCQDYLCVEDYMWEHYMKDEYERRSDS